MRRKYSWAIVALFIGILIVANPSERSFLERVGNDYGDVHHGMDMDADILLAAGESQRHSYLLFSMYEYRFGTISVHYVGVAQLVFYVGSSRVEPGKRPKSRNT